MSKRRQANVVIVSILVLGILCLLSPSVWANPQSGAESKAEATQAGVMPAELAAASPDPVSNGDLGRSISLANGVAATLEEIYLIPQEEGQILYVQLAVNNRSGQPFDFYPFWLRVESTYGERFKVSFVEEQRSSRVFPQSTKSFAYFALLPHQFGREDIKVHLIKWDFSMPSYERLVHSFTLPSHLEPKTVAEGETGYLEVYGVPIGVEVTQARVMENSQRKMGIFTLRLVNQGNRAVSLPAYDYYLQGQGYLFPAEKTSSEQELLLLPKIEKKLTIRVPMAVDADIVEYRLVMAEPKQKVEPGFSVPKTSFALKVAEGPTGGLAVGETTTIMSGNHEFDIRVENIHLLPTTNLENMLSYDVYLTNKNNSRVALPELVSYVHVPNENPKLAKQKEEEKKELFPHEELKLTMYASLPGKANLKDVQITLESKLGTSGEDELAEVYATYQVSLGTLVREGAVAREEHHFSDLGDRSVIKHYQTTTYETNYSTLLVSQFLIENKETRPIRVPEYKGYYRAENGAMFPVQYKGKEGELINPGGAAVITFWAEVNKGLDLKGMSLVLGIPVDEESEAMTEPVRFQVLHVNTPVRRSTAYPVSYHISSMRASAGLREEVRRVSIEDDPNGLGYFREIGAVSLEYTMRKDFQPNILPDGYERTLTFELVDSSGYVRDRRENVSLDKEILNGKNMLSLSANVPLAEVFSLRVKVYENFEHGRQLIGTYSIGF